MRRSSSSRWCGGKGVELDYRVTAEEAFLTFSATRTTSRPWGASGGKDGSNNGATIFRADGTKEHHTMVTGLRVERGETIRVTTATGGGFGLPAQRPRVEIERDLRNGFLTTKQAQEVFDYPDLSGRAI